LKEKKIEEVTQARGGGKPVQGQRKGGLQTEFLDPNAWGNKPRSGRKGGLKILGLWPNAKEYEKKRLGGFLQNQKERKRPLAKRVVTSGLRKEGGPEYGERTP